MHGDVVRLFLLAGTLPFVEATGRRQAAVVLKGGAEHGLLCCRLNTGIIGGRKLLERLFPPQGYQSSSHIDQLPVPFPVQDDIHRLSGSNVVVGLQVPWGTYQGVEFVKLLPRVCLSEPSAHASVPTPDEERLSPTGVRQ